jgi:hypothetical protein
MVESDVDPWDGYSDLVATAVRSMRTRTPHKSSTEEMRGAADEVIYNIEDDLSELADATWHSRRAVEEQIDRALKDAFRALDSAIGFGNFALRHATKVGKKPPDPIPYCVIGLGSRAVSTSQEILALLRAGFPAGAKSRWRTLSEILVVARVLVKGNRSTAARYINHRWVMYLRDHPNEAWEGPGPSPEAQVNLLRRRYGQEFLDTYGWAALISRQKLGVARPKWHHLQQLADLDEHRPFVKEAHHDVHADSLGLLGVVNEEGYFHAGTSFQGIASGCLGAIRLLNQVIDALLMLWNTYPQEKQINILRALTQDLSLGLERRTLRYLPGSTLTRMNEALTWT